MFMFGHARWLVNPNTRRAARGAKPKKVRRNAIAGTPLRHA
jgi:hypothetical protein